eukprot:2907641-Ditylum_brightwellii.AAC.1
MVCAWGSGMHLEMFPVRYLLVRASKTVGAASVVVVLGVYLDGPVSREHRVYGWRALLHLRRCYRWLQDTLFPCVEL